MMNGSGNNSSGVGVNSASLNVNQTQQQQQNMMAPNSTPLNGSNMGPNQCQANQPNSQSNQQIMMGTTPPISSSPVNSMGMAMNGSVTCMINSHPSPTPSRGSAHSASSSPHPYQSMSHPGQARTPPVSGGPGAMNVEQYGGSPYDRVQRLDNRIDSYRSHHALLQQREAIALKANYEKSEKETEKLAKQMLKNEAAAASTNKSKKGAGPGVAGGGRARNGAKRNAAAMNAVAQSPLAGNLGGTLFPNGTCTMVPAPGGIASVAPGPKPAKVPKAPAKSRKKKATVETQQQQQQLSQTPSSSDPMMVGSNGAPMQMMQSHQQANAHNSTSDSTLVHGHSHAGMHHHHPNHMNGGPNNVYKFESSEIKMVSTRHMMSNVNGPHSNHLNGPSQQTQQQQQMHFHQQQSFHQQSLNVKSQLGPTQSPVPTGTSCSYTPSFDMDSITDLLVDGQLADEKTGIIEESNIIDQLAMLAPPHHPPTNGSHNSVLRSGHHASAGAHAMNGQVGNSLQFDNFDSFADDNLLNEFGDEDFIAKFLEDLNGGNNTQFNSNGPIAVGDLSDHLNDTLCSLVNGAPVGPNTSGNQSHGLDQMYNNSASVSTHSPLPSINTLSKGPNSMAMTPLGNVLQQQHQVPQQMKQQQQQPNQKQMMMVGSSPNGPQMNNALNNSCSPNGLQSPQGIMSRPGSGPSPGCAVGPTGLLTPVGAGGQHLSGPPGHPSPEGMMHMNSMMRANNTPSPIHPHQSVTPPHAGMMAMSGPAGVGPSAASGNASVKLRQMADQKTNKAQQQNQCWNNQQMVPSGQMTHGRPFPQQTRPRQMQMYQQMDRSVGSGQMVPGNQHQQQNMMAPNSTPPNSMRINSHIGPNQCHPNLSNSQSNQQIMIGQQAISPVNSMVNGGGSNMMMNSQHPEASTIPSRGSAHLVFSGPHSYQKQMYQVNRPVGSGQMGNQQQQQQNAYFRSQQQQRMQAMPNYGQQSNSPSMMMNGQGQMQNSQPRFAQHHQQTQYWAQHQQQGQGGAGSGAGSGQQGGYPANGAMGPQGGQSANYGYF